MGRSRRELSRRCITLFFAPMLFRHQAVPFAGSGGVLRTVCTVHRLPKKSTKGVRAWRVNETARHEVARRTCWSLWHPRQLMSNPARFKDLWAKIDHVSDQRQHRLVSDMPVCFVNDCVQPILADTTRPVRTGCSGNSSERD